MQRRGFLRSLATPLLAAAQTPVPRRPNILLIVSDDQGFGDLSSHGNQFLKTPTLDQLGRDGVEFTRFHACPVCAPTRASILTGRYHLRSNVHGVTAGRETARMTGAMVPWLPTRWSGWCTETVWTLARS